MSKTEKSLVQQIGDLVAIIQEGQSGPEFSLKVSPEESNSHKVELHFYRVKTKYADSRSQDLESSLRGLSFITWALSLSDATKGIRDGLAEYIRTNDRNNHCCG